MLRICALNESSSEEEEEEEQVETKEAQEANLLDLYNSALQAIVRGNKPKAQGLLLEITQSPLFGDREASEGEMQKTLRYNVHKNLGSCYSEGGELALAEDHYYQAAQMDGTDVTLWFSLAGVAAKLHHLHMCRGALEQGLSCSPNHWPSLENLITVTFKLDDNMGCLKWCALALERDPANDRAQLYKSKVYNEMPFLRLALGDLAFTPRPTEPETYTYLPPAPPPTDLLVGHLPAVTLLGLGTAILAIYARVEGTTAIAGPIDTARLVEDCRRREQEAEEARVRVSVQNLVEEMVDLVEDEEGVEAMAEELLEEVVCAMFGVAPPTEPQRIVARLLAELVDEAVETAGKWRRKGGLVLDSKGRPVKKHFSIFDEIPDELIEKRRSSRKAITSAQPSGGNSSEVSQEVVSRSQGQDPRDLLLPLLPPSLRNTSSSPPSPPSPTWRPGY